MNGQTEVNAIHLQGDKNVRLTRKTVTLCPRQRLIMIGNDHLTIGVLQQDNVAERTFITRENTNPFLRDSIGG